MEWLSVFLLIILAVFAVLIVIIISLVVAVSRQISRVQQDFLKTKSNIGEFTSAVSVISYLTALIGGVSGKTKRQNKKQKRKESVDDKVN